MGRLDIVESLNVLLRTIISMKGVHKYGSHNEVWVIEEQVLRVEPIESVLKVCIQSSKSFYPIF